jgi:fatty acid synthase
LGLDSLMGVEIKQTLERDFDIVLSQKEIRSLTLNKLKGISSSAGSSAATASKETAQAAPKTTQNKSTPAPFVLRLDVASLRPKEDVIVLNPGKPGVTPVFFVHSIEGIGKPLTTLAAEFGDVPCYCFQGAADVPMTSVESFAGCYLKKMQKIQPTGPYRIVGYSFGAAVAFELASQLKRSAPKDSPDPVQALVLLDGAPDYMPAFRSGYRTLYGKDGDAVFESEAMLTFLNLFVKLHYNEFRKQLLACSDAKQRVELVIKKLQEHKEINQELANFACNSLWNKLNAGDKYKPTSKYDGSVTLVRAQVSAISIREAGEDYSLNKHVNGKINVLEIEGDHNTFILGDAAKQTAGIIKKLIV